MKRLGTILAIGGFLVLGGYSVYYGFRDLFRDQTIYLAIKVAVPALVVGLILLLASVGWERCQSAKKENSGQGGRI